MARNGSKQRSPPHIKAKRPERRDDDDDDEVLPIDETKDFENEQDPVDDQEDTQQDDGHVADDDDDEGEEDDYEGDDDDEFAGNTQGEDGNDEDDDDDGHNDQEDDKGPQEEDGNDDIQLTTGMANAMARILGGALFSASKVPSSRNGDQHVKPLDETKPVVLSKTKTPLQVQAAKEEKARRELLETRRIHKEKRQLTALHIPLSVATARTFSGEPSSSTIGASSIATELEQERMHRRVATRGIVVLFNAIATHQVNPTQTAVAAAQAAEDGPNSSSASKPKASKLTKHGFLDLIKQTAAAKVNAATAVTSVTSKVKGSSAVSGTEPPAARQWNALKDDYMLDSKMNWDEDDENDSLDNEEQQAPKKKRHKARG
jgi:Rrp15p